MIIVTGAAGFIGYRVAESLIAQGQHVIGVDELSAFDSRPEHQSLPLHFKAAPRDLLNPEFFRKHDISGVIHMGACSSTTELRVDYLREVNTDYSKWLWLEATKASVPFVYASSAATYGAGEYGFDDDETLLPRLKPLNPYGQSKHDFDVWVLDQERLGNTPPTWSGFKFFNVYGFGERHKNEMSSVVLKAYDQIKSRGYVELFESHREGIAHGEQARDFICVEDVVKVLTWALNREAGRGILNCGSGLAETFKYLVECTFKAMNLAPNIKYIPMPEVLRERYQYYTKAEMSRLRLEGYADPLMSLEQGVRTYVDRLMR